MNSRIIAGTTNLQNITQEIKSRADIVTIIERYVKLKKSGKNYQGLCPFHQEKTPSFIVSPDIQIYKCFGCGKAGDVFSFLEEIEGLNFIEARDKLADELGIKIEKNFKKNSYSALEEINKIALEFYQQELNSNSGAQARKYLQGRSMKKESILQFGVGFAPGYSSLYKMLTTKYKNKFSKAELLSSGLFVEKEGGVRDKFFNRVMFPIRSLGGVVVGFSGRVLPGNDYGPKYMNTPETQIFHKGETLFGIYEGKSEIRKSRFCILCEGQTDVISSHAVGVKNIVAPMGTGLTEKQIALLKNYTTDIILMLDSDKAGISAIKRAFTMAVSQGMNVYASSPAPYKDIDEMIQKDEKAYIRAIRRRTDAFSFLLTKELETKDLSNLSDYDQTRKFIDQMLSPITDKQLYDFYCRKAEKISGITIEKTDQRQIKPLIQRLSSGKSAKNKPENREQYFLALIFKTGFTDKLGKLNIAIFTDRFVKEIIDYLKLSPNTKVKELVETEVLSQEAIDLAKNLSLQSDMIMTENVDINKELNHIYMLIYKSYMENRLNNLRTKVAIAESMGDIATAEKIVGQINKLSAKMKGKPNGGKIG